MTPLSDFHIHSFYSGEKGHAEGSIEDIVEEARRKGLKEILITDHGPGHYSYGLDPGKIRGIRNEVDRLNDKYDDIDIQLGCEANVMSFSGEIDIDDQDLKYFDKIAVGYHNGIVPRDLKLLLSYFVINNLSKILPFLRKFAMKLNTQAMVNVIKNNNIFTITHPGSKARVDIYILAQECVKHETALEINSSRHGRLSAEDILIALKTEVNFTLGSDAHRLERIGDLKDSIERVKLCGVPKDRIINQF